MREVRRAQPRAVARGECSTVLGALEQDLPPVGIGYLGGRHLPAALTGCSTGHGVLHYDLVAERTSLVFESVELPGTR